MAGLVGRCPTPRLFRGAFGAAGGVGGLDDDDGGLVFGVEAEGLFDEGVGFFGELGVGVVVLPAVVEGLEFLDGAFDAGGVVGSFDVVFLEEGVFCGDVSGLFAGDDLEGAEVEVDPGELVSGVFGAEGHLGVEGLVGAEEVVLPDGVGLGALGVFCADAVGHDLGLVGAEALVDDGADDVVLDGVVAGGLSGEDDGGFAAGSLEAWKVGGLAGLVGRCPTPLRLDGGKTGAFAGGVIFSWRGRRTWMTADGRRRYERRESWRQNCVSASISVSAPPARGGTAPGASSSMG